MIANSETNTSNVLNHRYFPALFIFIIFPLFIFASLCGFLFVNNFLSAININVRESVTIIPISAAINAVTIRSLKSNYSGASILKIEALYCLSVVICIPILFLLGD